MPKKYFWIKLKDNFFKQLAIKKLRKVAGGDTFVIIYLKMMLLSMNNEGKIIYECCDGSEFAENLAIELDEDKDNVDMTLAFLGKNNLIEFLGEAEAFLPAVKDCIGCESDSAERVRKHRKKAKALQCNNSVTDELQGCSENVTLEKEIEKEKDIEIDIDKEKESKGRKRTAKTAYASSVRLSAEEYADFVGQYGENVVTQMIEILNNYKESTGKTYKSDAAAIRSWVVNAYFERANKGSKQANLADAQQELARRIGDNGNDDNTNHDNSVWGVWGE